MPLTRLVVAAAINLQFFRLAVGRCLRLGNSKWLQQLLRTMLAPICVCMDENLLHSLKKSDTGTSHGHVHIGAHWVKVESPSKYIKIMLTNMAAEVDEVQSLQSNFILGQLMQATYPVPNSHILRTVSRKTAPITSPKSGPSAWRTT